MPLRLEAIVADLPAGFAALHSEARAEGYRMLDTLATDWRSGVTRFDREGEALLAAYRDDVLAGIGGITAEPAIPGAFRMRRFYIGVACRRAGIGRSLAEALLAGPIKAGRPVTANAAPGSEPFWEALGFVAVTHPGHTHLLRAQKKSRRLGLA